MDALIYANNSIKSAFDTALYDIASQARGLPLYAFLGGTNNKELVTDYTISLTGKEKMASDAEKLKRSGFQVIKVKLGESREKDVARIRAIRDKIGPEIPLRIDANQGWTVPAAKGILHDLKDSNIEFCEEPIPRWAFMDLPGLRRTSPIKIMADESCFDHHDAHRLIQMEACDYFNLKLGKSGIYKSLKIIEKAEKANMKMQVGGFIETRLGFTASAHLSLSSKNIVFYDFDTPLMMTEDPVTGGIQYDSAGKVTVPETPGLGAAPDMAFLKKGLRAVIPG